VSRTYQQKFLSIAVRLEEAARLISTEAYKQSGEPKAKLEAMRDSVMTETTKAEEFFGPRIARELSYDRMRKSKVKW
jgi:hypothetical protein